MKELTVHDLPQRHRTVLAIDGMTCAACARTLSHMLSKIRGVDRAEIDLGAGQAFVEGRAATDLLVHAVTEAGYTARIIDP